MSGGSGFIVLTADGGVFFDAAIPGEAGDEVSEGDPEGLDDEAADEVRAGGFAHVNAYGKVELVRERREVESLFETVREDVQREKMAAGDVFEGEEDEDEGGDFKDPKSEHGHGVGGEELEHGGHYHGKEEAAESGPVWRQDEVFAEAQNKYRKRNCGDCDVGDAARKEQAKTVNEVIDGFEKELADVAVFDVGGDLPVVFVHCGEGIDDGDEQIIGDHLGEGVGANAGVGTLAGVDGAPDVKDGDEWDETKDRSREEIETVRQIVLNADVEDVPVFSHE